MLINCNLKESDYRAFQQYVRFRYRKEHWYYAFALISLLAFDWFIRIPKASTIEKIASLIFLVVLVSVTTIVVNVSWGIFTRLNGGRYQGSIGLHTFEVSEDKFVESNTNGRQEVMLSGLKHIGETKTHFFILCKSGTGYVIPKLGLENFDSLHQLQKRVEAGSN
jgi:YcxB-like protein